jgi:hypothetical protein
MEHGTAPGDTTGPGHGNLLVLLAACRGLGACHQSLPMYPEPLLSLTARDNKGRPRQQSSKMNPIPHTHTSVIAQPIAHTTDALKTPPVPHKSRRVTHPAQP